MAHKKGQGSVKNGRDSNSKRRGVKKFGGEHVIPGNIILRQCGTKWKPGKNVGLGKDTQFFHLLRVTLDLIKAVVVLTSIQLLFPIN